MIVVIMITVFGDTVVVTRFKSDALTAALDKRIVVVVKLVIFIWLYNVTDILPSLPFICGITSEENGDWR